MKDSLDELVNVMEKIDQVKILMNVILLVQMKEKIDDSKE
jgi:hypothetical protein